MAPQGQPAQIDRDYVRLLMMMRRFVREEFATTVAISEPEAPHTLCTFAEQSTHPVLREMGKELKEMLAAECGENHATPSQRTVHYYRGVARQVTATGENGKGGSKRADTSRRIYRGRVVEG